MTPSDLLISAIEEQRPIVLILGQDAWADSEDGDSLLLSALHRLERDNQFQGGWSALLSREPVSPEFYEWLSERYRRRVHSSSLEALAELPWSAVFTSSLDPTLSDLLESSGREPTIVLTESERPGSVRSRARPPLSYLFSHAGAVTLDSQARPPASRTELTSRRTGHAVPLLNRVLETATTLGIIVVEGFQSGTDWFRIEDLLGILGKAYPRQVIWCGGRPGIDGDVAEDFDELVASNRILVEAQRLGTLAGELRALNRLTSITPPESEDVGVISLGSSTIETTPEERLRVEAVASIVDDSWTAFLPPLGKDAKYDTFRRFHGDLEGPRLLVEGVRRDFAIERTFERRLHRKVFAAINNHAGIKTPIIVEGQSGTGKSVALARTVARVRERKIAPVLYSMGRIPQPEDVSDFCEAAERAGAKATLLVCDANKDVDQYHELLTGLRSRGRRVVVLGSQYRVPESSGSSAYVSCEAPTILSGDEWDSLEALLKRFDFKTPDPSTLDHHILAYLYRVLPASRPRIGAGLGSEAIDAEEVLRLRGRQSRPVLPITQMQEAMKDAGLLSDYGPVFDERQSELLQIEADDAAGRIIDLVMLAGSLNCPIPVNLLVRSVTEHSGVVDHSLIADLFHDLDLFRWEDADPEGTELLVVPRLILEAQLICWRRLGGADGEARRLLELIGAVRTGIDWDRYEVRFLLNLLQQVSDDGLRGQRYKHVYVEIARTLTTLREKYNVVDASLILQESAFRRSAIRCDEVEDMDREPLLEEARDAIQYALDGIADGSVHSGKRTKQNLLGERAAIYGFLARYRADLNSPDALIWSSYLTARTAIHEAASASDSYYPLDVGLWTPLDLLKSNSLTELQRIELAADIYSTQDQVQPESLPPNQREKFETRRMMSGSVLQDNSLTDDAYAALENSGSTAGYFLRARDFVKELDRYKIEVTAKEDLVNARRAAEFLHARFNKIEGDARCLSLLLDCCWIAEMRRWPLPLHGERQPLPFDEVTRRGVLEIVQALNQASGEASRRLPRYLEAVLTWLIGDEHTANQVFRDLDEETAFEFSGRVIKRHILTDSDGTPLRFEGRVERERSEGRFVIRVSQINRGIVILGRDFPNEDLAYGRTVRGFGIAFNFIGPIADPIRR